MDFYKTLFLGTTIFLILTLAVMGYFMSLSKSDVVYPPEYSSCPDNFLLNDASLCVANNIIYTNLDSSCNNLNFTDVSYTVVGTSFNSGLCKKKLLANSCKITWDGITNNGSLCYS